MKRALWLLLVVPVLLAARPQTELDLLTRLNGVPVRWTMLDGGQSGLFSTTGGLVCSPLTGTDVKGVSFRATVVKLVPLAPMNVCVRPYVMPNGVQQPWDGGCNGISGDSNFGDSIIAGAPYYFVPQPENAYVCAVSDAGVVMGALYDMR